MYTFFTNIIDKHENLFKKYQDYIDKWRKMNIMNKNYNTVFGMICVERII